MADGSTGPRTADVVDGVAWDYDPEQERLSPLVSTRRWFRDFPWEPDGGPEEAVGDDPVEERPAAAPR